MTCPKTHLNILQFRVLSNQNLEQTLSLFPKDDLYDNIFMKKSGEPGSDLTAYEIAVANANHKALETFHKYCTEDLSSETVRNILKTAIKYDRGSTIGYLLYTKLE